MKDLKVLGTGCSKKDGSRYTLEHIKITPEYAEITDGRILIRRKHIGPEIRIELKEKKSVLILPAILKNTQLPLIVTDTSSTVDGGNFPHPTDIDFPDTDLILQSVKKLPTIIKICLNKSILLKLLKALPKGDMEGVTFNIKGQNEAVYFTHNNCEGVILPMKTEE